MLCAITTEAGSQCSRQGKLEHDGQLLCRQHWKQQVTGRTRRRGRRRQATSATVLAGDAAEVLAAVKQQSAPAEQRRTLAARVTDKVYEHAGRQIGRSVARREPIGDALLDRYTVPEQVRLLHGMFPQLAPVPEDGNPDAAEAQAYLNACALSDAGVKDETVFNYFNHHVGAGGEDARFTLLLQLFDDGEPVQQWSCTRRDSRDSLRHAEYHPYTPEQGELWASNHVRALALAGGCLPEHIWRSNEGDRVRHNLSDPDLNNAVSSWVDRSAGCRVLEVGFWEDGRHTDDGRYLHGSHTLRYRVTAV